MNKTLYHLAGSVVVGSLAALAVDVAPVQAFSLSQATNSATFNTGDAAGTKFTIDFNGIVNGAQQSGLTAQAVVTLVEAFNGGNEAKFSVSLTNTSTAPITNSRVSIFGFDVSQSLNFGQTTVTGDFDQVGRGNTAQPNAPNVLGQPIGQLDVCFKAGGGPACAGGGDGGFTIGETGVFDFTLKFASNAVNSFTITNPYVRYQSIRIAGVSGQTSGVGAGKIPTPAMLPGLIGMGLAALRKRREEDVEQEETVNV